MPGRPALYTFVRLPIYLEAAPDIFTDEEERWIEQTLCESPDAGDTIANTAAWRSCA